MWVCLASAALVGCAPSDDGLDVLGGDESSDIGSDDSEAPAEDGLNCNEYGECAYQSIDQLADELLELFPKEGVNYRGVRKGSVTQCSVVRDFLTGDNISKPFQRILLDAGDTMQFVPYDEGQYPTQRVFRQASDSGVTYVDVRRGGVRYKMNIGYGEDGAISALAIDTYGDGSWLKGFTCRDLQPAE